MSETFEKPLEQRVEELESLVWEFPTLMNLRFERFERNDATDRRFDV